MTTDHGGSIPYAQITAQIACDDAQTISCTEGDGLPKTPQATDWRTLPRNERAHNTIKESDTVGVLLSNSPVRAWVELADYERIVAAYGSIRWHWNGPRGSVSILLQNPRQLLNVARLVVGEEAEGFVQYHDDDRLNLRRSNLSVELKTRPRRDGLTKVRAEKAAQLEKERAERRALRAERAAEAAEKVQKPRKRAQLATPVRHLPPPPPLAPRPQVAGVVPRKPVPVVQAVRRTSR